jgi:hypothetical protein
MISVNMPKAKTIAHELRRAARAAEFAPHDEVIAKRIPGTAEADAEAARQAIREKYATVQTVIDAAANADALKAAVDSFLARTSG